MQTLHANPSLAHRGHPPSASRASLEQFYQQLFGEIIVIKAGREADVMRSINIVLRDEPLRGLVQHFCQGCSWEKLGQYLEVSAAQAQESFAGVVAKLKKSPQMSSLKGVFHV